MDLIDWAIGQFRRLASVIAAEGGHFD